MPTVRELAALYETFMVPPRLGPGVCRTCLTFTDAAANSGQSYAQCYPCAITQPWLDAVAPISYSVAGGQLHHALASYKRLTGSVARRLRTELAAVLWRYLAAHESCLAAGLGVESFELVTTVPSGRLDPGRPHPLQQIVGEICGHTRDRYELLLERESRPNDVEHEFDAHRFRASAPSLPQRPVLLIDDTWTTGASAQSAAAALKRAGAGPIALVVIGRHLKRDWRENGKRLDRLPGRFDWETCVHCQPPSLASASVWRSP